MDYSWLENRVIEYRRDFHKFPESGWLEFRTTSKIAEILSELGFEVHLGREILNVEKVFGRPDNFIIEKNIKRAIDQGADEKWIERMDGFTGCIGILDTKLKGDTTLIRFDIDAISIDEPDSPLHFPKKEGFSSQNKGVMHACGHDGHTAIGLGVAHILSEGKSNLTGKVVLLFQPAEEGVRGANAISIEKYVDNVDYFFSGHIGLGLENNEFCPNVSGLFCTKKFDVEYVGKSSHAGKAPNEGKNALLAGAVAALNMHAIAPHGGGIGRINVGTLRAGENRNSIASRAIMEIETRGENEEINDYFYKRALDIIEASAKMYGVDFSVKIMGGAISVKCDKEAVEIMKKCALRSGSFEKFYEDFNPNVSEDASILLKRVQNMGGIGTYMIFGSNITAGHHKNNFDFDEDILVQVLKMWDSYFFEYA